LFQTYKNIEYIIVDGASTDGTLRIIEKYGNKINKVISERDEGIYDAMNKGLRNATGSIVYFLNSDDVFYDENVVSDVADVFAKDEQLDLLYAKVKIINIPQKFLPYFEGSSRCNLEFKNKRGLLGQGMTQQNIFCRKRVFEVTGLFSLEFSLNADFDWLLKAMNNNIRIKYMDRYCCYFNFLGKSYVNRNSMVVDKLIIVYRNSSFSDFCYYVVQRALACLDELFRRIRNWQEEKRWWQ